MYYPLSYGNALFGFNAFCIFPKAAGEGIVSHGIPGSHPDAVLDRRPSNGKRTFRDLRKAEVQQLEEENHEDKTDGAPRIDRPWLGGL
jgi:hypothetical protein